MENSNFEIKEMFGKKFKFIKTPCKCRCHQNNKIKHIKTCCDNGIKTTYEEVIEEPKNEK